ncbi:MAG: hypothetical protein SGARI_002034 [Bacillariaceae sp.]
MTFQREVEAVVGGALIHMAAKSALRKSKMVEKSVYLPKHNVHMHYLEREAVTPENNDHRNSGPLQLGACCRRLRTKDTTDNEEISTGDDHDDNMAGFVHSLEIPDEVRVLAPDQIGHGMDLDRVKKTPETYQHPTQLTLLESTSEWLDVVGVGSNTNAFGISMGGGIAYFLRAKRPDIIQKTVLVSPAIPYCVNHNYMDDFVKGEKNFMCFENRKDVKILFRDLSTGEENNDKRAKKDPVPTFFLEAVYRLNKNKAPDDHYREMLHGLLDKPEEGQELFDDDGNDVAKWIAAERDVDRESHRLVIWPDEDRIISYENGKHFFGDSVMPSSSKDDTKEEAAKTVGGNTRFVTITDAGHVFHADGTTILVIDWVLKEIRDYLIDFKADVGTEKSC